MLSFSPLMLIDAGLRGTLLALLLLLSIILLRDRPDLVVVKAGVALCLGLCVQVFSSTPAFEEVVPAVWQVPLIAISVANGVLFWVFVQALFDDDFRFRPIHGVSWCVVMALTLFNCLVVAGSASIFAPAMMGVQRGIPLLFAILAAWAAARSWRTDLVEQRRRLRAFIVVTGVAYTLIFMIARLGGQHGRLTATSALADVLMLLGIIAVITYKILMLGNLELFPALHKPPAPDTSVTDIDIMQVTRVSEKNLETDAADTHHLNALQTLMQAEHLYRSENLSLASLAARMQLPEYRLRRLINQALGYRNFNSYINAFRLAEARTALTDPARRELPVLTIALSSGFQSIGPFNRAFKAATGLTPTEFRKQNMAES
ncbi:helix-turn-helix domain-containing protein [Undibacterium sp. TS12]|uniref:helix-turn-helix domain-containing protein n=1 Tax=Undibacterium sp. TS12 TaxID=2908202 RepID=UPI001F4C6A2E|nr:helix-turn-helix domain-containing protein [Undibacterium sp. TS12]MCH8619970.1 helix-turn-helix domain-containing protein [Undibacterium sp. TS12]